MRELANAAARLAEISSKRTTRRRRGCQIALAVFGVAGLHAQAFATNSTWNAATATGTTQTWEVNSNWLANTQYPNSNAYSVIFKTTTAAPNIFIAGTGVGSLDSETINVLTATVASGGYTVSGGTLNFDANRTTTGGAIPISAYQLTGDTLAFNNNVSIYNSNTGNVSQFDIECGTTTTGGVLTFGAGAGLYVNSAENSGTTTLTPVVLITEGGGVINVNGTLSLTSGSTLSTEYTSGGASIAGTVNLNFTNGATNTGIQTLNVGAGSSGFGITTNLSTSLNLTTPNNLGALNIDGSYSSGYVAGVATFNLTGNNITVTTQKVTFEGANGAADVETIASTYPGTTTNTLTATGSILLASSTTSTQQLIFSAAANNTLNLGTDSIQGGSATNSQKLELIGPGTIDFGGASSYGTQTSFTASGATLVIGSSSTVSGVATITLHSGPVGQGTFNITNGTVLDNGTAQTIYNNIFLGGTGTLGDQTAVVGNGLTFTPVNLTVPTTFTLTNNGTLVVNNSTLIANVITDNTSGYSLTKTGSGTLTLTGTNTYSGGTTFGGGILDVGNSSALGTAGTLNFAGGILQYGAGNNTDYSARFNSTGNQSVSIDTNGQVVSFATPLVGTGSSLALSDSAAGTGTLLIPTSSTYTGATSVTGGTLDVTGSVANSATVTVSSATIPATVILDGANAVSATAPITVTGAGANLVVNNAQALASISSTGNATFTAGTSTVGQGNGIGTGAGGGSTTGGISGSGTLTVNGTANLYAANITQSVLKIGATNTVTIADSAAPGNASSVSVLTDLNNSGTLDLNNNDLIVTDSTQYSTIKALINNAADGGAWDQPGITSSSARANTSTYGLGYAPASDVGTTVFDGVTLAGTETIVKYTLLGDTQLRGAVGIGDYDTVLSNYGTGTDWSQGNFHYSGVVGIGDYDDVLSNYGAHPSGNLVANPALTHSLSPALSLSPDAAKSDLKLEVNTTTGDVYLEATTSVAFAGYTISDPSAHLLAGSTSPDPAKLLSVAPGNGGNTNSYETGSTYINWFKISETSIQLSEGQNNNGFANHSSRDDTINIPAGGTIDFGDIYNTAVNNQDISFDFAEAGTTPTNGPAYYGAEVDYVGGVATPEPASVSLLAIGAAGMLARRRRRIV